MSGGDSGPAIVPGKPRESSLIEAVLYENEDLQMPPKGKLSDAEIQILVRWVKMGAPDPRTGNVVKPAKEAIDIEKGKSFWAFRPPRRPPVPAVEDAAWARHDIDRFLLAEMEAKGVKHVAEADRRTLIRRATFDLVGLPPTPEEVEAFVSSKSPDAFAEVVDRLLELPQFGERWGRHWLDVARYAESTGKTRNYPYLHAWRYRDYVIDSFNRDKPYDRFIAEQIAGDLLPVKSALERDEARIATGFLAMGTKDLNERNQLQFTMDNVDEQVDTMSRAVLALTVSCARCHDHKFDPIPTSDYYSLAGIFKSTEILSGVKNRGGGKNYKSDQLIALEVIDRAKPGEAPAEKPRVSDRQSRQIKALERKIKANQRELARLQQLRKTASSKGQKPKGQKQRKKRRKQQGDVQSGPSGTLTPAQIIARFRNAKRTQKKLASAMDRLQQTSTAGTPVAIGVREHPKPQNCRVMIRGDVRNLGAESPRGFIQVLSGSTTPAVPADASGRAQLAEWLTSRDNPLTARVFVNRVWHHLFGRGLVRTVDNFGSTGERPSHPELLDYLAVELMDEGWSIKKLIRTIVLSSAYRLSSAHHDANYQVDPDNRLVWRMNQRRLEIEAFRDAMLAISGRLVKDRMKGSLAMNLNVGEIGRGANADAIRSVTDHRSVYQPILRGMVPDMFVAFDFAEPSAVKGRRDVTTVATQALYMMNSPFVIAQSQHTAQRLLAVEGLDDQERVQLAYQWTFARPARPEEAERAFAYVTSNDDGSADSSEARKPTIKAWAGLCQALFASAEFRYLN